MALSWITLYPQWYIEERRRLLQHYPGFKLYEPALGEGVLIYYGELEVRPTGGVVKHPVRLLYPQGTPFRPPIVTPLDSLPEIGEDGTIKREANLCMFDERHQMPNGALCLFQRETRAIPGGDIVRGIDALRRAQQWFLGSHTGHWPPDSAESEIEAHFTYATDVLLSALFFSHNINGHGQYFMVPDLRRLMDSNLEGMCPMIVTALTEETGIIRVFDARDDLSRVYPWIQADAWNPEKIADIERIADVNPLKMIRGYWWSLPGEPRPFHNGEGLLRELASVAPNEDAWHMVASTLKSEITFSTNHFIGLRYPGRYVGVEWLMIYVDRGERKDCLLVKSDDVKRREFEQSPVYCLRAHSVRPVDLRLRNTGVVDNAIQNKTVALVGLGALGSTVAELLAKAGVGKFRLCDCDCLSTGNVARHVGGLNEFGAPKTRVVMSRLLEINPYLRFSKEDVISGSAIGSLDRLAAFIEAADLTISTTADESVESVINQVAVINQKTVVYGRSLRRGSMGRVFLVRPSKDACKECLSKYALLNRLGKKVPTDWIEVTESEDDILLHECGRPVIPASAIDLSFVAALIARAALDFLEGTDGEINHWLWSRLAAVETDPRLDRNLCTFLGRLEPRFGCPACQEPDVVQLIVSAAAYKTIVESAESSPDKETCGILVGFVNGERQAIALRAIGPGPNAERSRTGCSRDVEYVQAELDRVASELGTQGSYIGEWHSHLVPDPQPSSVDIESLFGISKAPNYLTRCPVMVIVGLDPLTQKVTNVRSYVFPIGGRMYAIENEIDN